VPAVLAVTTVVYKKHSWAKITWEAVNPEKSI